MIVKSCPEVLFVIVTISPAFAALVYVRCVKASDLIATLSLLCEPSIVTEANVLVPTALPAFAPPV